jgi:hypothetical protein
MYFEILMLEWYEIPPSKSWDVSRMVLLGSQNGQSASLTTAHDIHAVVFQRTGELFTHPRTYGGYGSSSIVGC